MLYNVKSSLRAVVAMFTGKLRQVRLTFELLMGNVEHDGTWCNQNSSTTNNNGGRREIQFEREIVQRLRLATVSVVTAPSG